MNERLRFCVCNHTSLSHVPRPDKQVFVCIACRCQRFRPRAEEARPQPDKTDEQKAAALIRKAGEWLDDNMAYGYGYDGDNPSEKLEEYAAKIESGEIPL